MIIRKNPILQTIVYVVILFWGLSFSPSCYATSEKMTYYAFVMYKASAGSTWELPPNMEELEQGSYRFQIVRLWQEADYPPTTKALRGEFEFVLEDPKNPKKGVKLSEKETLDSKQDVNVSHSKENSLWHKTPTDNWAQAGLPLVQALIVQMNISFKGDPDPNFMRFLVLKKKAKFRWVGQGKQYTLYRLHYFPDNSLSNDEALKALSRFVDPNEAETTDIATLKKWIGEQDSFKKARYLGEADARHKEFYEDFQTASNDFLDKLVKTQAQKNLKQAEEKIQDANGYIDNANEQIAKAKAGDDKTHSKENFIEFANNNLNLAENALNTAQAEIDKAKEKIDNSKITDVQNQIKETQAKIKTARQQVTALGEGIDILTVIFYLFVAGVGLFLLVMFFTSEETGWHDNDDDDEHSPSKKGHGFFGKLFKSKKKHHGSSSSSKQNRDTQNKRDSDEKTPTDVDGQNDLANPQNDDFVGAKLDKPTDRGTGDSRAVPSPQPSADYVLKHDLNKIVENQALVVLSNHFGQLLQGNIEQLQYNQYFKKLVVRIVKEQVVDSLNKELSEFVDKQIKSTLAKPPAQERTTFDDQTTPSLPSSDYLPIQTTAQNMGIQADQRTQEKQPNQVVEIKPNKVVEIKTVLISMNAVDKAEIEHLETTTDPCTFVTQVVSQCLELNQPITFYRRLNESIQNLTDEKVSLILPNEGDDTNQEEHKVVQQQTVTKGRTNVIASVIRPGVRCDGTVKRKAEVVQKT